VKRVLDGVFGLDESVDSLPLNPHAGPSVARLLFAAAIAFPKAAAADPTKWQPENSEHLACATQDGSQPRGKSTPRPHPFLSSATDRRRRWGRDRRRGRGRGTRSSARAPGPASTISRRCSPASSRRVRTPAPPTPPSSRNSSTRCSASGAPSSARPPLHLRSRYLPLLLHFALIFSFLFFSFCGAADGVVAVGGRVTTGSCPIRHRRLCG
jgi:hypothetical protein